MASTSSSPTLFASVKSSSTCSRTPSVSRALPRGERSRSPSRCRLPLPQATTARLRCRPSRSHPEERATSTVSSTRRIRLDADADPVRPSQVLLRTLDLVRSFPRLPHPQTQPLTTTLSACTGLAPESLSILFQRFQQASSSTHTVFGGSGLGVRCVPCFCPRPLR